MSELRCFLVCYDIDGDRDRNWVAKQLGAHGNRVQESVFECYLDHKTVKDLLSAFMKRLAGTDEVSFYPLCRSCRLAMKSTRGRLADELPRYQIF